MQIGYVGLGNMGANIASHLATYATENGHTFIVWNRDKLKYDGLRSTLPGATFALELEEVAAAADIVFTSLLNDAAATDVYSKLFAVAKGTVFVDQSSINPKTSIKLETDATNVGCTYLSAPVFGRPDAAKAGKLIQVIAGDVKGKEKVKPLFEPISRAVIDVGTEVYKGTTLKLMGNALILGVLEMLGETFALGDAVGIDPQVFQHFIELFFPTPSYTVYGKKIADGSFSGVGGFRLEGGLKDARNILAVGADLGHPVALPTIELAKANMERAEQLGGQDLDWSSLAAVLREQAGLAPFRDGATK